MIRNLEDEVAQLTAAVAALAEAVRLQGNRLDRIDNHLGIEVHWRREAERIAELDAMDKARQMRETS